MRRLSSLLLALACAVAPTLAAAQPGAGSADAARRRPAPPDVPRPDVRRDDGHGSAADPRGDRDHRDGDQRDRDRDDRRGGRGPRAAPPPLRDEAPGEKAGYVWIPGQWEWRNDAWAWTAGHWERPRAGKRWSPGRWDKRDDAYVWSAGRWDADAPGAPAVPPPIGSPGDAGRPGDPRPGSGRGGERPRQAWKLERPVISSYWPTKGTAGQRVIVRGRNLPTSATVLWNAVPVRGARVTAEQIVFQIPAGSTGTGTLTLDVGRRGRPLLVGSFEVAAAYDADAEARRVAEAQRRAAEAAWTARQARLAKDRASREAAWRERRGERERTREQRREETAGEIRQRWQRAFLADADVQDELQLHARRVAELERMRDVADLKADARLAVRIEVANQRETARHDNRMAALQAAFPADGGN